MAMNKERLPVADIFVSVIGVLDPGMSDVADFVRRLHTTLNNHYANYELVLVDNGVGAEELIEVRSLLAELSCVRILRLSRQFMIDTAIFAGLESAIGDFIVVLTPGRDPTDAVANVVDLMRRGNDVVQGISRSPLGRGWVERTIRLAFYWYNRRVLRVNISPRATHMIGLTRRAANSLTSSTRSQRYVQHLVGHVGYRIEEYKYQPVRPRQRSSVLRGRHLVEAVHMISSYSAHPLQLAALVSGVAAALNLLYALYLIGRSVFLVGPIGTAGLGAIQASLMFFVIGGILAVQAEYVGRILSESRREPSYYLVEELESETLLADIERRNVTS